MNDLAVLVGELAYQLVVDVLADLIAGVFSKSVRLAIAAKHFAVLVPLHVVLENAVVELLVLLVQLWVIEDAGLQQVVTEVRTTA